MSLLTLLLALAGYGLLYAAAPGRHAARRGVSASARRWCYAGGGLLLALAGVCGALAWGLVTGLLVAGAAALTAASLLVLTGPLAFR